MSVRDKVEKFCRAGQAADINIIWHKRTAVWIPKTTNTHSEYVILFHCDNGYTNVPQFYIIHILPVFVRNNVDAINCKGIFLLLLQSVSMSVRN